MVCGMDTCVSESADREHQHTSLGDCLWDCGATGEYYGSGIMGTSEAEEGRACARKGGDENGREGRRASARGEG